MRIRRHSRTGRLALLVTALVLLGQMAVISTATADAAPANDDFDSASVVAAVPHTAILDVATATASGDDPGFPCTSNDPRYRTVWYRYTPATNQSLIVDTFGSNYDTVLGVWTGSRGSLTNVGCSDDYNGLQSSVEFGATAGTTYHIEVASFGPTPANSQLTLNLAAAGAKWTVMVYLNGESNQEYQAIDEFLEMSSVGSNANVNVVVQMDRIFGYSTAHDDWTDTRRFLVTPGMTPSPGNGTSIGEANMGDPATLAAFIQWARATYPADHYALILWDYWAEDWRARPLNEPGLQSVVDDWTSDDELTVAELRTALDTATVGGAQPIDLMGLDLGMSASVELDSQLRPYVGVRVGSQASRATDGWPFDTILTALVADPAMTRGDLGTVIADAYYAAHGNDETQSAADLGADYANLVTAIDNFATALITYGAAEIGAIKTARQATQAFQSGSFDDATIDLYDFAVRVRDGVASGIVVGAAVAVIDALGPALVREASGPTYPDAHGISIYFPEIAEDYDTRYDGTANFLQLTMNTNWDEWVHAYYAYLAAVSPGAFGKAAPVHEATGQLTMPTLSWGVAAGATSYEVCIDTWLDALCQSAWEDVGNVTTFTLPAPLSYDTVHYWQVRAVNGFGHTYANGGTWWRFTTTSPTILQASFRSVGVYDGWVLERDETSGKGGTVDAAGTTARLGDNATDYQYRSILHFDTSSLPDDAVVTGVTLRIKRESFTGTNPFNTHGILKVDMQAGAYHDDPLLEKLDFHAVGSRGNVGRFIKTPAAGWYRAPLRAPSYDLINLTDPTQFRLRFDLDDNDDLSADFLSFFTGDAPTLSDRPELIVSYYVP